MVCKGCGNLPPVRIQRTAKASIIKPVLLRPKRKRIMDTKGPKPANEDRYRI